jgi:guanosine-3',5'-bis(diphosphate) 3'-pyrophosphohydrolase
MQKLLKLADKICNVHDMINSPPPDWPLERKQEYLLWTEKVVAGLRGVSEKMENDYDNLLKEGKRLMGIKNT